MTEGAPTGPGGMDRRRHRPARPSEADAAGPTDAAGDDAAHRRRASDAVLDLGSQRRTVGRRADDFRLVSPAGAAVVRPDRLDARSRVRAMLPSAFTLTNMLCGFSSIRAAESGHFDLAAVLISVAILFDIFD